MTSAGLAEHCVELLAAAGPARARRMFGGHGLYVDELFVAVIVDERLYLKVNEATRARFEAAGCVQWVYDGREPPMPMPYYSVPDEAMDSPAAMRPWALLAVQAAREAALARKPRAKTKTAKAKLDRPGGQRAPKPREREVAEARPAKSPARAEKGAKATKARPSKR